ncbi:MAG: LysR family transcriptional regulator [Gammaproteobacteria bacterium]
MEYKELPDLKALAALRAVVELGGVAEAGRALHIGQPAVTKRLRTLDRCYGVELMYREGRRLELTPAGEKAYAYARLMLEHHGLLLDNLAALRSHQDRLRLEVTFAIGEHLLPDLLLRFADAHPGYRIESRMGYTRRISNHLATGLTDLALLEQAPDHPEILVSPWLEDELLLVCGQEHPLWDCPSISCAELSTLRFVLREPRSSQRVLLDRSLHEARCGPLSITMEVGSTDTIVEMLQRGRHVSILPRFSVADALDQGSLHHIRVTGLRVERTLWIARTRATRNNPVAEAFVSLLRDNPVH